MWFIYVVRSGVCILKWKRPIFGPHGIPRDRQIQLPQLNQHLSLVPKLNQSISTVLRHENFLKFNLRITKNFNIKNCKALIVVKWFCRNTLLSSWFQQGRITTFVKGVWWLWSEQYRDCSWQLSYGKKNSKYSVRFNWYWSFKYNLLLTPSSALYCLAPVSGSQNWGHAGRHLLYVIHWLWIGTSHEPVPLSPDSVAFQHRFLLNTQCAWDLWAPLCSCKIMSSTVSPFSSEPRSSLRLPSSYVYLMTARWIVRLGWTFNKVHGTTLNQIMLPASSLSEIHLRYLAKRFSFDSLSSVMWR